MKNPFSKSILDKPVYISASLEQTSSKIVGDRIVASVKWNKKNYEVSLRVKLDGKNQDIATLADDDLAKKVETLVSAIFEQSAPVDGQKIQAHSEDSQEQGKVKITDENSIINGDQTLQDAAKVFKRSIAKSLINPDEIEAEETPTPIPYKGSSNLQKNSKGNIPGKVKVTHLEDRPYMSHVTNDFKIFANENDHDIYFVKESSEGDKIPRHDYQATIILSPDLQKLVAKKNDKPQETITYKHRFFYTSVYNHTGCMQKKGKDGHKYVYIDKAIPTRHGSKFANMARVVLADDDSSIVYTGKIDTKEKANALLKQMIKIEYAAGEKSKIKRTKNGFVMPLPVLTLLSSNWVQSIWTRLMGKSKHDEYAMLKKEQAVLEEIAQEALTVEVEPGKTIKVQVKPFFINTGLNGFLKYPLINGKNASDHLSAKGEQAFQTYIQEKINDLATSDPDKSEILQQALDALNSLNKTYSSNPLLQKVLKETLQAFNLDGNLSLKALQSLIIRAFICKLLDLPILAHCKSSIDRTSLAIGVISAVNLIMGSDNSNEPLAKVPRKFLFITQNS